MELDLPCKHLPTCAFTLHQGLKQKEQRDFDSNGLRFWISIGKVGVPVVKLQNRKYCYRFTSLYCHGENVILIHASVASPILHLISSSRSFRYFYVWVVSNGSHWSHHEVLTRKSRDSKKIWAIWMQPDGTCGVHDMIWYYSTKYIAWIGDLLYLLQKKWDSSQDVFSIVLSVGSTLFPGALHIYLWNDV